MQVIKKKYIQHIKKMVSRAPRPWYLAFSTVWFLNFILPLIFFSLLCTARKCKILNNHFEFIILMFSCIFPLFLFQSCIFLKLVFRFMHVLFEPKVFLCNLYTYRMFICLLSIYYSFPSYSLFVCQYLMRFLLQSKFLFSYSLFRLSFSTHYTHISICPRVELYSLLKDMYIWIQKYKDIRFLFTSKENLLTKHHISQCVLFESLSQTKLITSYWVFISVYWYYIRNNLIRDFHKSE